METTTTQATDETEQVSQEAPKTEVPAAESGDAAASNMKEGEPVPEKATETQAEASETNQHGTVASREASLLDSKPADATATPQGPQPPSDSVPDTDPTETEGQDAPKVIVTPPTTDTTSTDAVVAEVAKKMEDLAVTTDKDPAPESTASKSGTDKDTKAEGDAPSTDKEGETAEPSSAESQPGSSKQGDKAKKNRRACLIN